MIDKVSPPEIVDPHMHVGDFPLFDVGMDADGLVELFAEWGYAAGIVFHPDNALVRDLVEGIPNAWALYWANPRVEGCADEAREFLAHPKFRGVKMHPLLDSYHPNDPIVHPVARLLVDLDMPVLIHSGHPIFTLPWSIEELVVEFPELKVVLGHMGHGNIVYINAAIDIAARNPNVWLETSGMPMHTKIRTAVERVGRGQGHVRIGRALPRPRCRDPEGGGEWAGDRAAAQGAGNERPAAVLGKRRRAGFRGARRHS